MTPAIPAGYRRIRVGEKRPKGYKYLHYECPHAYRGWFLLTGVKITPADVEAGVTYIAPVRRRKGGKKGRAK